MWQTLTSELVFEIFRHFLPRLMLSVTRPESFPWHLGQICSLWRHVFLSSPEFWCRLEFNLDGDYGIKLDTDRALTISTACLPRSDPYPFSFRYTKIHPSPPDPKFGHCRQILNLLINQSTRWRDAYFQVQVTEIPIIYAVKNKLPILRSIKVDTYDEFASMICHPDSMYDELFLDTPQLKRMFTHKAPYWKVNWSSLKAIYLSFYNHVEDLEVLSLISRLEELTIDGGFRISRPEIVLPFLKILRSNCNFLSLFKTPLLNELCIKHTNLLPDLDDILRNFLPSLNHLTRLTLITFGAGDVEILLQYMPCIQHLSLYVVETFNFQTLSKCAKLRRLKTLTITRFRLEENDVNMIKMWIRRKSLQKEDHRFDELQCFYLVIHKKASNHLLDEVKRHLDLEDIPHSFQKYVNSFDMFDVFDD